MVKFSSISRPLVLTIVLFWFFSFPIVEFIGWREGYGHHGDGSSMFWGLLTALAILILTEENEDRKDVEERLTTATEKIAEATEQLVKTNEELVKITADPSLRYLKSGGRV